MTTFHGYEFVVELEIRIGRPFIIVAGPPRVIVQATVQARDAIFGCMYMIRRTRTSLCHTTGNLKDSAGEETSRKL